MSASYWSSSQRLHWQFTRNELNEHREQIQALEKNLNVPGSDLSRINIKYDTNMRIYLHNLMHKLGRKLVLRQVILSTAEVFMTRFLLKASIKEVNIYLLVATCIYVACKMEECPQHIRNLVSEARNCWPEFIPNDLTKLAEFEFYLIEELDCFLLVHHPYNSLISIVKDVLKDPRYNIAITTDELQTCWSIINDSYITDMHLLFPPHIVAITSLYMTLVTFSKDSKKLQTFVKFLAHCKVDLDEIIESTQELLTLYEYWNSYDELSLRKAVHRLLLTLNNSNQ
ncbi:hypothetical protein LJB42_004262 [Komagataella kurtzmanii]|nr:hypothetical protein LJB42_004262 [Komagataella kurtzmanii]